MRARFEKACLLCSGEFFLEDLDMRYEAFEDDVGCAQVLGDLAGFLAEVLLLFRVDIGNGFDAEGELDFQRLGHEPT